MPLKHNLFFWIQTLKHHLFLSVFSSENQLALKLTEA